MHSDQCEPKYKKELTGKSGNDLRAKLQLVLGYSRSSNDVPNIAIALTKFANFCD